MKSQTLFLILILSSIFAFAQPGWQKHNSTNGLFNNNIVEVLIADDSSIWIASPNSISHIKDGVTSNFFHNLTGLPGYEIKNIELDSSGVWLQMEGSISFFDGSSFTKYDTSNGLIQNKINDITVDLNGDLWIAGQGGVSTFDGNQFTNWHGKLATSIEADSNNNVYILKYNIVANVNISLKWYEYFDGTNWLSDTLTNLNFDPINLPKLKRLNNGELIIIGNDEINFNKIQYPFIIHQTPLLKQDYSNLIAKDIEVDNNGNYWMINSNGFIGNLYMISNLSPTPLLPKIGTPTSLSIKNNMLAFSGDQGVYIHRGKLEPIKLTESLGINNIGVSINIEKTLFEDSRSEPGLEFPKGSNKKSIYSSSFIFSAKKKNEPFFTVYKPITYNVNSIGPVRNKDFFDNSYLVKVNKQEILIHKTNFNNPNYLIPNGIKNWPANGDTSNGMAVDLAPFIDVNSNGCYDPNKGDYPKIKGDEAIYWIKHKKNSANSSAFEFHYLLYAYNDSLNEDINNSLFLNYTIINRSTHSFDSVKLGYFVDTDLGYFDDDYTACDSSINTMYTYNGDAFDDSHNGLGGYASKIPTMGIRFLSDSMTNYMQVKQQNIQLDIHSHNYLNSIWPNGQPLRFGGDGWNSAGTSNQKTNYMYTGDPILNSGWTEANPGNGQAPNAPGDRRALASIPYFSLAPNERKSVDIVFGYGLDTSHTNHLLNINDMKRVLNYAKQVYDSSLNSTAVLANNNDCIDTVISIQEIEKKSTFDLYPNPAQNELFIESKNEIQEISLFDIRGTLVFRNRILNEKQVRIHLNSELSNGIYFVRISSQEMIRNQKLVIQRK